MTKSKSRKKKNKKARRKTHGVPTAPKREEPTLASYAKRPIGPCFITGEWRKEAGLATVCFTRELPKNRYVGAIFLVDLGCLGVKDVLTNQYLAADLEKFLDNYIHDFEQCDPALGVKVVTSAVDFARSIGFEPPMEYLEARQLFGEVDPNECDDEVTLGRNGMPLYVAGPHDDVDAIVAKIEAWEAAQRSRPRIYMPGEPEIISPHDTGDEPLIIIPK